MLKENLSRIDVRAKLIILFIINVIAIINDTLMYEIVLMGLIISTLIYSKLYKKAFQYLSYYLLLLMVIYFSSVYTNPLTSFLLVICMAFRSFVAIFAFGHCIIATTKVSELLVGFDMLRVPKSIKIPFSVILSYIPALGMEFKNITDAMKMRGFGLTFKNAIIHPIKTSENIVVPLIVRSSIIAEEISVAVITRGIESEEKRTTYYPIKFNYVDILYIFLFFSLFITCLYSLLINIR